MAVYIQGRPYMQQQRRHGWAGQPWHHTPLSASVMQTASHVLGSGHVPLDVPLGHFPWQPLLKVTNKNLLRITI